MFAIVQRVLGWLGIGLVRHEDCITRRTTGELQVCAVCAKPIEWAEGWYRDDGCWFYCERHHPHRDD